MPHFRCGQPGHHQSLEPVPCQVASFMAPMPKRPKPAAYDLGPESIDCVGVARHGIIIEVTVEHGAQPLPLFRDGDVHPLYYFFSHFFQLCLKTLGDCLAPDCKSF